MSRTTRIIVLLIMAGAMLASFSYAFLIEPGLTREWGVPAWIGLGVLPVAGVLYGLGWRLHARESKRIRRLLKADRQEPLN